MVKLSSVIKKEIVAKTILKSRQLSVREEFGGSSSVIRIVVKDEKFPLSVVEDIVAKYESIDRCEKTGEILSGGNTLITVNYAWDSVLSDDFESEISLAVPNFSTEKYQTFKYGDNHLKSLVMTLNDYLNEKNDVNYTFLDTRKIWTKFLEKKFN